MKKLYLIAVLFGVAQGCFGAMVTSANNLSTVFEFREPSITGIQLSTAWERTCLPVRTPSGFRFTPKPNPTVRWNLDDASSSPQRLLQLCNSSLWTDRYAVLGK